jgi:hypothetical protein
MESSLRRCLIANLTAAIITGCVYGLNTSVHSFTNPLRALKRASLSLWLLMGLSARRRQIIDLGMISEAGLVAQRPYTAEGKVIPQKSLIMILAGGEACQEEAFGHW